MMLRMGFFFFLWRKCPFLRCKFKKYASNAQTGGGLSHAKRLFFALCPYLWDDLESKKYFNKNLFFTTSSSRVR